MGQPTDPETHLLARTREEIEKALDGGGWSPLYGIIAGAGLHVADAIDGLKDAVLDHTDPAKLNCNRTWTARDGSFWERVTPATSREWLYFYVGMILVATATALGALTAIILFVAVG